MAKARILELMYSFDVEGGSGGVGRFVSDLSRSLPRERYEVSICGLWNLGTEAEQERIRLLNADGVQAFAAADWEASRPYLSFWRATRSLLKWLRRNPVDLIHSHSEFSDVAALLARLRMPALASLRTVHYGYRYEWRKRPLRRLFLTNFLYPLLFDAEVGVSQSIADALNRRLVARLLRRKSRCIYNAIDLDRFAQVRVDIAQKKRSLNLPCDAALIGSVGRLTEQKGYGYWVEAAALALARLNQVHFLLIGEGELAEALQAQVHRLGAGAQITLAGSRSDIEELLACMDLFVSSSLWEGLPTVILESMACGLPVVATDIPGTRELIQPGVNGWLAPPADAQALCDAIVAAMQSPLRRAEMAVKARETVKKFSLQAVARQYIDLYDRLAPSSKPRFFSGQV
jgi:glycosyltransferase involved in cell wall biosynthesis